jgi:hypothetical protein
MLNHPTLDNLKTLKLVGMIQGLHDQAQHPAINQLSFEERLGFLVDREMTDRLNRRLNKRLLQAKLKQPVWKILIIRPTKASTKPYCTACMIASGLKNISIFC